MDSQLRAAQEKLEREQRERKARAKSKMEREKRAKAEAARQREAIEAAQRAKRLDAARAQLEVGHQSSMCPLRSITCRFCGDMVQAGNAPADARDRLRGLCEHESICGSRTAPCDSCGRSIMC